MIEKLRKRSKKMAKKMADAQAKLFLNLFYTTMVPPAHLYLRIRGQLLHQETGYFQEFQISNRFEDHLKQY